MRVKDGGKGVISSVTPDELMPIMVDNKTGKQYKVEVVMNPYSTINRKIAGVLMEQELGLIAHRLWDLTEENKDTEAGRKKIMPLITKYYKRYEGMSVDEFIKLHNTKPIEEVYYFTVGCYSDYTPERVEQMMEDLGLESQSTILMPESEITDLDELRKNFTEEEYQEIVKKMSGRYVPVEKKLQCGWMVLEELYHIPTYSNKVTTSMFGVDINPRRDEPILGRGRYRLTGQKISEMDVWALLSRNSREFIKSTRTDTAKEDNQMFLNNLLGLGLTVVDDSGYNQGGSSLKTDLNKMKAKFRFRNGK